MRNSIGRVLCAAALVACGLPRAAAAQGYGVYEQGACAMGRAGATVASPCADGSAVFFNPAGLALQASGTAVLSAGGGLIAPRGSFTNTTTGLTSTLNSKYYPVPDFYYARGLTDRIAVGLGVFAPYGLETSWPTTSEGRFLGYQSKITGIYVQPTVAVKLTSRVMVGAGFDLSFASVGLEQRVDLATQFAAPGVRFQNLGIPTGTDFADVNLRGHATGVGYHVGVLVKVTDQVNIGARYMSRQKLNFNNATATVNQVPTGLTLSAGNPLGVPAGTPVDAVVASQFTGNGALTNQNGSTSLRFPEQLVVGISVRPIPRLLLEGDMQYTKWAVFDSLVLVFDPTKLGTRTLVENYTNTTGFRFGGEYELNRDLRLRAGYYFHQAASPDQTVTPNLPEGRRASFSGGIGARLTRQLRLDLAYQYIQQADRIGRSGDGGLLTPTTAVNNGLYTFHANIVGATFSYAF